MATTFAQPAANSNLYLNPQGETYAYASRPIMPDTPPSSASPEDAINPKNLWRAGPGHLIAGNPNIYMHSSSHTSQKYRGIRPMRNPLSVPAALRSENRGPRTPESPPNSQHNSIDESNAETADATGVPPEQPAAIPEIVVPDEQDQILQAKFQDLQDLYRDLSPKAKRELEHDVGEVTEPPTTAHWKSDSSSDSCAVCETSFTMFVRRHHCRHCGELVCHAHSSQFIRLDQNAHFHPAGHLVRGCDKCVDDFRIVRTLRATRRKRLAAAQAAEVPDTTGGQEAEPLASQGTPPTDIRRPMMAGERVRSVANIAASWTGLLDWSTF